MADSSVPVTSGSGNNIDTRTESTNSHHRQVIVVGDPAVNAAVAEVVSADPGPTSTVYGAVVRVAGSAQVQIAGSTGSLSVHLLSTGGTIHVKTDPSSVLTGISSSINVHLLSTAGTVAVRIQDEPTVIASGKQGTTTRALIANSDGAIKVYDVVTGTINTVNTVAAVTNITNSIAVHILSTGGTLMVSDKSEPTVIASGKQGTTTRALIANTDGAIKVYDIVTGTINTVASVTNITNSIAVHILSTGGTLMVSDKSEPTVIASGKQGTTTRALIANTDGAIKVYDLVNGTIVVSSITASAAVHVLSTGGTLAVKIDPGYNVVNTSSTITLPVSTSSTSSAVSVSGATIVSPESGRNIKVFAFSLTTTAQVHLAARFTNGAGTGPTEFWRVALQAPSQGIAGANLAVTPPGYLFATGSNTTLALVLDSASLVHYSVSYFKESA